MTIGVNIIYCTYKAVYPYLLVWHLFHFREQSQCVGNNLILNQHFSPSSSVSKCKLLDPYLDIV